MLLGPLLLSVGKVLFVIGVLFLFKYGGWDCGSIRSIGSVCKAGIGDTGTGSAGGVGVL